MQVGGVLSVVQLGGIAQIGFNPCNATNIGFYEKKCGIGTGLFYTPLGAQR